MDEIETYENPGLILHYIIIFFLSLIWSILKVGISIFPPSWTIMYILSFYSDGDDSEPTKLRPKRQRRSTERESKKKPIKSAHHRNKLVKK